MREYYHADPQLYRICTDKWRDLPRSIDERDKPGCCLLPIKQPTASSATIKAAKSISLKRSNWMWIMSGRDSRWARTTRCSTSISRQSRLGEGLCCLVRISECLSLRMSLRSSLDATSTCSSHLSTGGSQR